MVERSSQSVLAANGRASGDLDADLAAARLHTAGVQPVISTAAVGELDQLVPRTAAASRVDPSDVAAIEAASLDLLKSVRPRPIPSPPSG